MKKSVIIFYFLLFICAAPKISNAQEKKSDHIETINGKKYYMHTVAKGQTLYYISKLYNTSLDDLKKNNPELSKGLFTGQVLKIPHESAEKNLPIADDKAPTGKQPHLNEHIVLQGESVWTIAQKYKLTEKDILKENPDASKGLKPGQVLKIPAAKSQTSSQNVVKTPVSKTEEKGKTYTVETGETLFGISKKTGVSIEEIKKLNPEIEKNLKKDYVIKLPPTANIPPHSEEKPKKVLQNKKSTVHIVNAKETVYQISKLYGVTENDIYDSNPDAKSGLQIGQELIIRLDSGQTEVNISQIPVNTIEYTVTAGDNLYRIAKNNNTFVEDITKLNPELSEGLKPGMIIKVPSMIAKESVASVLQHANTVNDTLFHLVIKQETLYGIARTYGKTVDQLVTLNPDVLDGLREGQKLVIEIRQVEKKDIPAITTKPVEQLSGDCNSGSKKTEYRIGLLLPFNSHSIDFDKIFKEDEEGAVENEMNNSVLRSLAFFDFYQGLLVAADSLAAKGLNLKLYVYDTNKDSSSTPEITAKPDFQNMDVIIGPVFNADISVVYNAVKTKQTPIILPLSPVEKIDDYSNLVQLTPSLSSQLSLVANYICNTYQGSNIILVHNDKDYEKKNMENFKSVFAAKNIKFNEIVYNKEGHSSLENKMTKDTNNIVILLATEQIFTSNFLRKLNLNTENYRIVVFGPHQLARYSNIEFEYISNLSLHLYSPSFVDYSRNDVKNFIQAYRDKFKTEPSRYAFQGYDTGFLTFNAIFHWGTSLVHCIDKVQGQALQTKYLFSIGKNNTFENKYVNIFKYSDYQLHQVY